MRSVLDENAEIVALALECAGLTPAQSAAHAEVAAQRLRDGAEKYGEGSFRDADCAAEATEEGVDGGNWAAFELVNLRERGESSPTDAQLLIEMISHFALAARAGREYQTRRAALAHPVT